jgi:tetratricopeptide (TPR) repeat protein
VILAVLLQLVVCSWPSSAADERLAQKPWVEVSTAHFNFYSCGPIGGVYKLAGRLEQFCSAYTQLAGAQAVAAPPIVVMVFPDHESMEPFLPLYQGRPISVSALFQHGLDENLIVVSLPPPGSSGMDLSVIFHEYAHFLFRRNDGVWPLWLKEGMAEVYSTFQTAGRNAWIGVPIEHHLRLLGEQPLMPLAELFSVKESSPDYNEQQRQGLFYAESWLLTHFLMAGDNPQLIARFGQFNTLLHQGEFPVQAFTNALQTSLPGMAAQLHRYLLRSQFRPIDLLVNSNLSAPVATKVRRLARAEIYFRLGDELMRLGVLDDANYNFVQAQKLAPASPWPEAGLGLLADRRGQRDEAVNHLKAAIDRGSDSFLVFYIHAREMYRATGDAQERHTRIEGPAAAEIRDDLARSLRLMPDFAPAHELLGFFEMVQGDDLAAAGQQLSLAIQLEPENRSYLISLAQLEMQSHDAAAARQTLQPLLRPNVAAELRSEAQALMKQIANSMPAQ